MLYQLNYLSSTAGVPMVELQKHVQLYQQVV